MMWEIKFSGFGGQGIVRCALITGKAIALYDGKYATMTQNFGPEARGGACSAQLILSDQPVLYPYVTRPDLLVVMSQEAYNKFAPELKPNGTLIIERDLVSVSGLPPGIRVHGCPATRLAEELGKRMVSNSVMVGFFAAVGGLLKRESLRQAVADSVPEAFRELNLKAFDKGFDYAASQSSPAPDRVAEFA